MREPTKQFDEEYLGVLRQIFEKGIDHEDRTGTGRRSLNSVQMCFDITEEFPLLTTKRVNFKAVVNEFIWMVLRGSVDVNWLNERGHTFWDEWKGDDGTIGPGYGKQFRDCKGVDQVEQVVDSIKNDPYSSRHIISLWQPDEIVDMMLPPCHGVVIQFFVEKGESGEPEWLSCQMYQRSGDFFLGIPFNIAFYSLFTKVLAYATGLKPKSFSHIVGDAHIYLNHLEQVEEQLTRTPKSYPYVLIAGAPENLSFFWEDIVVVGYNPHPAIKAPISI